MAETRSDRGSSFWVWATIAIVIAAIVTAVIMTRDETTDEGTIPQVETGRTP